MTKKNNGTTVNGMTLDPTLAGRLKGPKSGVPKRWVAVLVIVAFIAAFLVAWIVPKSQAEQPTRQDSVTIGLKLAPTNLDIRGTAGSALDQLLIGNVYEGLVARDESNGVKPALAKSWTVSDDGLTYTFSLNRDATFSNGDKLTAADAVWSIQTLVDNQYHDYDQLRNFKSVSAPDDYTVVIALSEPYPDLLWALTGRAGLVFDSKVESNAATATDMKTSALGSGPYAVASFNENDSVVLKANPDYWGESKAQTATVVVRYFTDDNAAVNALSSGDVQVLAPISSSLATTFENNPAYIVQAGDGTDKYVLGMNNAADKATGDIRVRQAIRYAIDHEQLIASRGGTDKLLGGPIPSLDPGYEDLTGLYPYDLDKAKELLEEAGYDENNPLKLTLTYANTYGTEIGDQLRSQLKKANIDLTVNVVEFSTWLQQVYTDKDYDLSIVDHNESHDFSNYANPDYYFNYTGDHAADVQQLTAQALSSASESDSETLLARAARLVSEDAVCDWLFNYRVTTAMAAGVSGFPVNMNQTVMPLYDVVYVA
ncbi:ABC transporter substrate-binding protein [Bifidobacterium choloepi]|uniref:ABC transporter substrate-binding protein n=1 Tax=Bifidobacterium choloepi TaxID=2614131 RepID=A0A6I5NDG7_9BIFI|nr:ABC transporter substrate-binding protein [Bifidobacterium choloepi]NEG69464.1 ABC transporter substrate-binding protein [Bifidobacterium choloepi]